MTTGFNTREGSRILAERFALLGEAEVTSHRGDPAPGSNGLRFAERVEVHDAVQSGRGVRPSPRPARTREAA